MDNLREVISSSRFKRDLKLAARRGQDVTLLRELVLLLQQGETLPTRYKDHWLSGNWAHHRECHITPDWLLIYRVDENTVYLDRTGTHSGLFNK